MEDRARAAGTEAARGRVILARLVKGASLAAVREEKSIDTSMGFTPAAGRKGATRAGRFSGGNPNGRQVGRIIESDPAPVGAASRPAFHYRDKGSMVMISCTAAVTEIG